MKKLILFFGGLAVLAVIGIAAFVVYEIRGSDDPKLATGAPQIPAATAGGPTATAPSAATGSTAATLSASAPANAAAVHHYTIDSSQSTAKFVVKETLRGLANVTTVGQTSAISGDIFLTPQGLAPAKSLIKVDMNSLQTDESLRDQFIKRNTLQTSQFPTADFSIDSVSGFPTGYVDGTEVPLTLTGTMTIHGVTKPVTWQVKARHGNNTLTATADADIKMSDFGMTPPATPIAKADDPVHLQVVFVATGGA